MSDDLIREGHQYAELLRGIAHVHRLEETMEPFAERLDRLADALEAARAELEVMRASVSTDWRGHEKARGKLSLALDRAQAAEEQAEQLAELLEATMGLLGAYGMAPRDGRKALAAYKEWRDGQG